jgi:(p)ppGpp synthase/HD superfamily hydrolase
MDSLQFGRRFGRLVGFIFAAHGDHPTKPSKAVRKWDGQTPYAVHPLWCATMLLAEPTLSEDLRVRGSEALLLHDVLEDTTEGLPAGTSEEVAGLVRDMTFASSDVEMVEVWSKSDEVKLLKLYDKVSNLLDGSWMSAGKRQKYTAYTLKLADQVEPVYGQLNITRIARAMCE